MQFTPGDIIQDYEEPFIKYLNVTCRPIHCSNCFTGTQSLLRCKRCKMVYYCSSDCQKADWKRAHTLECKLYVKAADLTIAFVDDPTGQVVRLMCYLKLHAAKAKETVRLYNGTDRCFDDLLDHFAELDKAALYSEPMKELAEKLRKSSLFTEMESSYENVLRMYGKWKINGFSVANANDTQVIGSSIYLASSAFDHSCRPNAVRVTDEMSRMQIRCIDAIPAGEAPKITYLAGIRKRNLRQRVLEERYHFKCDCVLCETEKNGDVVDYVALVAHREAIVKSRHYADAQLIDAKFILQEMQKIFCRYDERVTNFYDHTLERLVVSLNTEGSQARRTTIPEVKAFAEQTEENIRITFGTGHRDYKYYAEQLATRLQLL